MNKTTIGIIVGVLIILGIGGFVISRSNTPALNQPSGVSSLPTSDQAATSSGEMSLKALAAAGRPVSCTFADKGTDSESTGTVFVANGKVRADFNSTTSAGGQNTIQGHMISDGQFSYVWTSLSTTGLKMSATGTAGQSSNSGASIDQDKKLNYTCQPWPADSSQFDLPKGITFSELTLPTGLVPPPVNAEGNAGASNSATGGASGATDVKAQACSACDLIPAGTSRDQCKKNYGC